MKIIIDNIEVEVLENETILQAAKRIGKQIPAMCYVEGYEHQPSCMVCMVKDEQTGQMLPSCSTYPTEGMHIITQDEEVKEMRRLSLELLLSDHRADCEAPCSMVCPKKVDVERILYYWERQRYQEAWNVACPLFADGLACDDCKRPCEKACRRGTVDQHVEIVETIRQLGAMEIQGDGSPVSIMIQENRPPVSKPFSSRIGIFSAKEKEWLKASVKGCLHCGCAAQDDCKLRQYATESGIKSSRFGVNSDLPFKVKKHVTGRLWFEPAKCIRCGLCVYNTKDGFTFKGRGFGMQVVIPNESRDHVMEDIANLCPTGALYLED